LVLLIPYIIPHLWGNVNGERYKDRATAFTFLAKKGHPTELGDSKQP
jgi:hypothetical protein